MDTASHPPAPEPGRIGTVALAAIAAVGAGLSTLAALVALAGDAPHEASLAESHALLVAAPIAVGLYAWREGTHARFGRLLVLSGFLWFVAALAGSGDEVLYSIGRVAGWAAEPALAALVLAFPSGRLTTRVDRWLVAAAVGLVAILFAPTALLVESYPSPSTFSTCVDDCPGNAFMLLDAEPAWVDGVVIPVREALASLILLVVVLRLADRIRRATRLMRRTLVPVLVFAILRVLAIPTLLIMRRAGVDDAVLTTALAVTELCLPAMCLGFLIGMVRWRMHAADCLVALAHGLRNRRGAGRRREVIAAVLGDPSVELAFWDGRDDGGWVDDESRPVALPPSDPARETTLIFDQGLPVAAVVHDAALAEQRSFVEAVGVYAFVWDDNRRLAARVEESMAELRASRARILAAADEERRRIERDLHDGGQQRLVALRVRLELAEELLREDPVAAEAVLHRLGGEIDAAQDELRSLAAGVYPSLLAARGLPEALRLAALRSPVPTAVEVDGCDRYGVDVETAAYFCCIEALQNVAKHAPEATAATIALSRNGDLCFEVRDDGSGFDVDAIAPGNGLANMRDRLAAVGGFLEIRSAAGAGTVVVGTIPVADRPAPYAG